jgi:hypothetical protein
MGHRRQARELRKLMAHRPPTISEVAKEIAVSLTAPGGDVGLAEARRLAFAFVESFDRAGESDRLRMIHDRPDAVGDARFDALLAALVEHLGAKASIPPPAWTEDPDRFLDTWWFMSGLRSLHADALVHSPISFARRGVFITGDALTYA